MLDLGIYGLHLAGLFAKCPDPKKSGRTLRDCKSVVVSGEWGVDVSDFILLEYSDGFVADVCCSIGFFGVNEACVFGETGSIRIAQPFNAAESCELFASPSEKFSGPSGFEFEVAHTMECIRGGKTQSDLLPMSDTIAAMEIIDKIRGN